MNREEKRQRLRKLKQRLYDALVDYYSMPPGERVISDRLGQVFIEMTKCIVCRPSFNQYPQEIKEELKSAMIDKMIRHGLPNFDINHPLAVWTSWRYFCMAANSGALTEATKYYNYRNVRRKLLILSLRQKSSGFTETAISNKIMLRQLEETQREIDAKLEKSRLRNIENQKRRRERKKLDEERRAAGGEDGADEK